MPCSTYSLCLKALVDNTNVVSCEQLISFSILAFQTTLITAIPKVLNWTINVNFLCNVYTSISITYLNSKFGMSSKKNVILVFFYFLQSKVCFYLLHNVTKENVGQGNGCFSISVLAACWITGPRFLPRRCSASGETGWLQAGTRL